MDFSRLTLRALLMLPAIAALLAGGLYLVAVLGLYVTGVVCLAAGVAVTIWLVEMFARQQRELVRFINAIQFRDFTPTFANGAVSQPLAAALDRALGTLRENNAARDAEVIVLKTLFENAPAPLFTFSHGRVGLSNLAARRIPHDEIVEIARQAEGGRALVRCDTGGLRRRYVVSSSHIVDRKQSVRIVAAHNIEGELGAAEFDAWRDLVRVLTHEIMNSLTPIASLSQLVQQLSAEMLVTERGTRDAEQLSFDLSESAAALAERSKSLLAFIESYRTLTRLPPPNIRPVMIVPLLEKLRVLFSAGSGPHVEIAMRQDTEHLQIPCDPVQIEQALLNLVANGRDASISANSFEPVVLTAERAGQENIVLSVADRGSGVAPEIEGKIFTPFFSTKTQGTGVGLSLVRQIMLAHRGSVRHFPREGGGTVFVIHLPTGRHS